jgi:hypothetical protein
MPSRCGPQRAFRIGPKHEVVSIGVDRAGRVSHQPGEPTFLTEEGRLKQRREQISPRSAPHGLQRPREIALLLPEAGQHEIGLRDSLAAADLEDEFAGQ